jgi:hypothetical protein
MWSVPAESRQFPNTFDQVESRGRARKHGRLPEPTLYVDETFRCRKVVVVETVLGMAKKCVVIWSRHHSGRWKVDWTGLVVPVAFTPSAGFAGEQIAFNARASLSRQSAEARLGRGEDFF